MTMSTCHPYCLQEELEQIATWCSEEGLAPDASKEAQLCLCWRAHQHTKSQLSSVIWDMDTQRSQHLAEMAEVCYYITLSSRLRINKSLCL